MPQLQSLVLKDKAASSHTFTPLDIQSGVGTVVESAGVPIGNNRVSIALNRTATGRYKGTLKFAFPVVVDQTVNGVTNPTVVRTSYCDVTFTFDGTSNLLERQDVVAMVQSAFASNATLVYDALTKLEGIY